ncbi:MAG: hypothetical protein QM722_01855 [Piscinibacter sp.]
MPIAACTSQQAASSSVVASTAVASLWIVLSIVLLPVEGNGPR